MAVCLDGGVALVQLRLHQQKRSNTADDVRELPRFVLGDVAPEHLALAVAEPFLEDLVSANRILPHGLRHVAPERFVVEINIVCPRAPQRRWITLGAWVLPALYIAAILFFTSEEDRTDDTQRARYLDSVKTLVTAAGLTIGVVISTALKPENAPSGWAETIRSGVIALAISIGCSVVTLFMLSILYDRAGNKVLKRREFLMVAPFMYFALAMFFTGFIYMVQLTTLVVAQPKLPPGGHP
jgi:hypothetical protein